MTTSSVMSHHLLAKLRPLLAEVEQEALGAVLPRVQRLHRRLPILLRTRARQREEMRRIPGHASHVRIHGQRPARHIEGRVPHVRTRV